MIEVDAVRRRFAPQLLADDARRTEHPLEAADVDRHEIVAMSFVSRRELHGDRHQVCAISALIVVTLRRSKKTGKHRGRFLDIARG